MTAHRLARLATVSVLLLAFVQGNESWALTDEQIFRDLGFNFVNPGARSLGMGGAFIAVGNDVTAGTANPAALRTVERMELLADFRSVRPQATVVEGDPVDLSALPVALPLIDVTGGAEAADDELLSFFGFAFPLQRGRTTLSLSRNVVLDTSTTLQDSTNRLRFAFEDYPIWVNPDGGAGMNTPTVEQYAVQSTTGGGLTAELVHYDLSAGIDLGSDLSVGVTATLAELDMRSTLQSTASDPRGLLETINPRVDADQDGLFEDVITTSSVNGSDSAFGFSLGLHYQPDSRSALGVAPVRFGLVYHKGAELSVRQQQMEGQIVTATFENILNVPDRIGFGVAGELGAERAWRLALDVEHVKYSDLLDGFRTGVSSLTSGIVDPDSLSLDPDADVRFDVDDAVVVRAGAEYGFEAGSDWRLAVRAGGYSAPDDGIRMTAFNSTDDAVNQAYLAAFGGGDDETHLTAGVSARSPGGFELHLAGDFADDGDQILLTVRYMFGRPRR
jgi:long-subunit fatty acid transport protein